MIYSQEQLRLSTGSPSAMTLDVSKVSFWSGRRALRLAVGGGGSSTREIASLLAKESRDLQYSPCDDENTRSALEVAASAGHLEAMERLLAAGAAGDPNVELDDRGMSALEAAAAQGQLVALQKLLEKGVLPDRCDVRYISWSMAPLIAATKAGHVEICKALLQAGADVNSVIGRLRRGEISAIKAAVETSNVTLLELFLGVVADAIAQHRQKDVHLLRAATRSIDAALVASAATGDMLALQRLLDVDVNFNAHRAIAAAAAGGHLDVMNKLLQTASNQSNLPESSITLALQSAVDAGNMVTMLPLLQASAASTKIDIRKAAAKGHLDVLTYVLRSGASAETKKLIPKEDENNEGTALQWAAKEGHLAVVDLLLARGSNVNAPAGRILRGTAVQLAFAGGHIAVTERLKDAGADVNAPPQADANTALQAAALELLLVAGNVVPTAEGIGHCDWNTALSATAEHKPELVATVLSMMHPDDARRRAPVALRKAVQRRNTALVQQLLQLHPDVDFCEQKGRELSFLDTLHSERLLDTVRFERSSATMLQVAVANGDLEILQMLLAEKADVNLNPSKGWQKTALQCASEQGSLNAVELLLDAGAEVNVTGSTAPPLLLAVQHGHKKVFTRLLEAGADIHARAYRGQTMLQAAQDGGDTAMEELVRAALDSRPHPQTEQSLGRGTASLCDACRTASLFDLFCDETCGYGLTSGTLLYSSLTTLRASACGGCPFCCFIWKRLRIASISLPQSSPVKIFQQYWHGPGNLTCVVKEPFPKHPDGPERLKFDFHYATEPFQSEIALSTTLSVRLLVGIH